MLGPKEPKWSELFSRTGTGADLLMSINSLPLDDVGYYRIFYECCDLETFDVYPAAYAIMPHLVAFASTVTELIEMQWPLFISSAICSNFKLTKGPDDVPAGLWDAFYESSKLAAECSLRLIQNFPENGPSPYETMMITPIFNLDQKPLFGNPQPNSFVLYKWFEKRRPKDSAR